MKAPAMVKKLTVATVIFPTFMIFSTHCHETLLDQERDMENRAYTQGEIDGGYFNENIQANPGLVPQEVDTGLFLPNQGPNIQYFPEVR